MGKLRGVVGHCVKRYESETSPIINKDGCNELRGENGVDTPRVYFLVKYVNEIFDSRLKEVAVMLGRRIWTEHEDWIVS
jgi:hypothetical protein